MKYEGRYEYDIVYLDIDGSEQSIDEVWLRAPAHKGDKMIFDGGMLEFISFLHFPNGQAPTIEAKLL